VADIVRTTSNTSFTWLTTFGGRHHSPLYSILNDYPWGLHPNGIFFLGLISENSKIGTFVVPKTWMLISSSNQAFLEHARGLAYIPQKYIFNGVFHSLIKNHLTFALKGFVVGSQIPNLTPSFSFDHNSCT